MIASRRFCSSSTVPSLLNFVPKHEPPSISDVETLQSFLQQVSKILVITGAGVSTESGIPDYRSEGVGLYARSNHRPMKIQDFLSSSSNRQRYWARNFFGWSKFDSLRPNPGHERLRELELKGKVSCLVTQNVDGLHAKAGSLDSVELHGTGHLVKCLRCLYQVDRGLFQNILLDMNSHIQHEKVLQEMMRPDGDMDLQPELCEKFIIPPCPSCGGILKPDIVFFGDNVPKSRVELIYERLKDSDSLLVLGSSLQTFSAFRYILSAKELDLPVVIINLGPTRADSVANIKLICRVGELLSQVRL